MSTRLEARLVSLHTDDDLILVGFADAEYDTREYLTLMYSTALAEQDRVLGRDTIYIEYCDQSRACYGGILEVALEPGHVTICLLPEAARTLGTDEQIEVTLPPDGPPMEALKDQLARMPLTLLTSHAG